MKLLEERLAQTEQKLVDAEHQNLLHLKTIQDQQNEIATLRARLQKTSSKVTTDRALQSEVRRNYQVMGSNVDETTYDLDLRFDCLFNRKVTERICYLVDGSLKGSYTAQEISDYCKTYFTHLRDDRHRELNGKKETHRNTAKHRNRLNRKLEKRRTIVRADNPPPLSADQLSLANEMLSAGPDYMSSDESDTEDNEGYGTRLKVRRLSWESTQMKDIKDIVDQHGIKIANKRQKAKMTYYRRDASCEISTRPVPSKLLNWAVDVFYTTETVTEPQQ